MFCLLIWTKEEHWPFIGFASASIQSFFAAAVLVLCVFWPNESAEEQQQQQWRARTLAGMLAYRLALYCIICTKCWADECDSLPNSEGISQHWWQTAANTACHSPPASHIRLWADENISIERNIFVFRSRWWYRCAHIFSQLAFIIRSFSSPFLSSNLSSFPPLPVFVVHWSASLYSTFLLLRLLTSTIIYSIPWIAKSFA